MLFQGTDIGRLVIIYIVQLSFTCIFLYLAYKILNRNKNRLTLTLSGFYISEGIAFIFAAIYPLLRVNPLVYILYFISVYLILLGQIFLVIFLLNLLKTNFKLKNQNIIIIAYAITAFILLNFGGTITLNEDTNWIPVWSWSLVIFLYIFVTCVIVIPFIFLFLRVYNNFEDKDLKKKLKIFFIGFLGITISFYGAAIYNTQTNTTFNFIWNFVEVFLTIPPGLLIYYAWAHQL